jgi:PEP-CTERM motif
MRNGLALAFVLAAVNLPAAASAQVTGISATLNRLNVQFTGTVTNDVTNSIQIRQPNGTLVPFTGPVPDYPYKVGDQVTIGFQTIVPNRNLFADPAYAGQVAADGIYRFGIAPNVGSQSLTNYWATGIDVSGPVTVESQPVGASNSLRGITIVYDANADSYSLELGSNGWGVGPVNAPTYTYDPATGQLTPRSGACFGGSCTSAGLNVSGNATSAHIGGFPTGGINIDNPQNPGGGGLFAGLDLSGLFNFGIFGGGGGSSGGTKVPEPSMMLLFGGGTLALFRRRRKVKAA